MSTKDVIMDDIVGVGPTDLGGSILGKWYRFPRSHFFEFVH